MITIFRSAVAQMFAFRRCVRLVVSSLLAKLGLRIPCCRTLRLQAERMINHFRPFTPCVGTTRPLVAYDCCNSFLVW
jgi:hypothetical protein